jgi:hypothetical protein
MIYGSYATSEFVVKCFKDPTDPRVDRKKYHKSVDIVAIALSRSRQL